MINISGNFDTTEKELAVVNRIFQENGIAVKSIEKYKNADDGDVLVTLMNDKEILIEVKEESYKRFSNYGDLGIDFLSAFYFLRNESRWKGAPKSHELLNDFFKDIDRERYFKEGKMFYSKADLWLFFVMDNDRFVYYAFFDGKKMISNEFREYLTQNCKFAINNKTINQLSNSDPYNSAVFFINHENPLIKQFEIDLNEYIEKDTKC